MTTARVDPQSISLAPGEAAEVTVTANDGGSEIGSVFFPVKSRRGRTKAELVVATAGAVLFGEPENPKRLPITIEVLEETATTCRYLITADPLEQLSRRDRRRLRRG